MSDNIIFRAKCVDNGEWVRGVPHFENNKCFMITDLLIYEEHQCTGVENVEVIPETVGQYTGLTDKNGKMIFEGDIGKFKRFENSYIGKIVYNQKTAGFEFWWNVVVGAYGEKATYTANLSVCDEIEIISNIHDNPELLKGECEK